MAFNRPLIFGIIPTWGKWLGHTGTARDQWDATMFQWIAEANCQQVSIDGGWRKVEPDYPGQYLLEQSWEETDHEVEQAVNYGMVPVMILTQTPDWAVDTDGLPKTQYLAEFNAFHTAMAHRYAGVVSRYQYENEPNYQGWTAERFGYWLGKARAAIKAGLPSANVCLGGLLDYNTVPTAPAYLTQIYDYISAQGADPDDYFDAVGLHPYGDSNPIDTALIGDVKSVMNAHGDADKKLWLTEWGWAVYDGWKSDGLGEHTVAQRIADGFNKLCFGDYWWREDVELATYHQMADIPEGAPGHPPGQGLYWGLCDSGTPPNYALTARAGYRIFAVWAAGALLPPTLRAPVKASTA